MSSPNSMIWLDIHLSHLFHTNTKTPSFTKPKVRQMPSLASKIEAVLYLKGQPMSITEIAEIAQCDRDLVKDAIIELMSNYAHRDTALEIVETKKGYSLQLKEAYSDIMQTLIPPELGVGALRTLAAIALKDGIPQTELVDLRGSGAYQHVQELVQLGFVRKRRQADARSYWVQVTEKFHQYFQLDQLPQQLSLDFRNIIAKDEETQEEKEEKDEKSEAPSTEEDKDEKSETTTDIPEAENLRKQNTSENEWSDRCPLV